MRRGKWFPLLASLLFWIASLDARALTNVPPSRDPNNVIVAFYNIKWFGKTPRNIEKLARVIQHFDICSVLEIKNERVLKNLVRELEALTSHRWGFVFGVRTHRPGGRYHEAFGVIWRKDRAELGHGLVGGVWDREEVFRNDPYLTAFKAGAFDFSPVLHPHSLVRRRRRHSKRRGGRHTETTRLSPSFLGYRPINGIMVQE